jgi:hypothetical protein
MPVTQFVEVEGKAGEYQKAVSFGVLDRFMLEEAIAGDMPKAVRFHLPRFAIAIYQIKILFASQV